MVDADLLCRVGQSLFGERWQTDLSVLLGVNSRTMRRWASGQNETPLWLHERLVALINERQAALSDVLSHLTAKSSPDEGVRESSSSDGIERSLASR